MFALEGAANAELQAISRVAEHRLERGIFTSTGGGDLRRALAAAERLAILVRWARMLLTVCQTLRTTLSRCRCRQLHSANV